MKDIISARNMPKIGDARGSFTLSLFDPLTGRIREQVAEINHIFADSFFSSNWVNDLDSVYLTLTDNTDAVDEDLPFITGNILGYGVPSQSGSGTLRGAYNAANQVLGSMSLSSVRWKFQYDFTTAQANGTIGTIGLTHQYSSINKSPIKGFAPPGVTALPNAMSDGRYAYEIGNATGVITITDMYTGNTSTVDVSSVVGTTSGNNKSVGYAPDTGRYYVIVYSSTVSARRVYEFSDNIFGTLLNTYPVTNMTSGVGGSTYPFYVRGSNIFYTSNASSVNVFNFAENTAPVSKTVATNALTAASSVRTYDGTVAFGKYIVGTGYYNSSSSSSSYDGYIFDMETQQQVGLVSYLQYATTQNAMLYPFSGNVLPVRGNSYGGVVFNGAVAAKKLDAPVVKTSAYGMTATYEIEVYWE